MSSEMSEALALATRTFNSMILWNGLVLLYAVLAEMIAAYIKK